MEPDLNEHAQCKIGVEGKSHCHLHLGQLSGSMPGTLRAIERLPAIKSVATYALLRLRHPKGLHSIEISLRGLDANVL
jgi:hypothetical protein